MLMEELAVLTEIIFGIPENRKTGYLKGDFNLDGVVNDDDLNFFWSISNGNLSQVPK